MTTPPTGTRRRGVVDKLVLSRQDGKTCVGFIASPAFDNDVMFLPSEAEGPAPLPGRRVEFDVVETRRGLRAINIVVTEA